MSRMRTVYEVARWEFLRFFKPRQFVIGLMTTLIGFAFGYGIFAFGTRGGVDAVEVAVIGEEALPLPAEGTRYRLTSHPVEAEASLRDAVGAGELAGLLRVESRDEATLLANRHGRWIAELQGALTAARQQRAMQETGVRPEALAEVLAPVELSVGYHELGREPRTGGELAVFAIALFVMISGIFTGLAYILVGVTGEKQQRVTEQVISAIPAQVWIDGKILGLSAFSLVNVLGTGVVFTAVGLLATRFLGFNLPVPEAIASPGMALTILLYLIGGFFFWFAFLVAVAAILDDPNTSSRGGLMFLPLVAFGAAFLVLIDADLTVVRVLSLLPPTSAAVMPARMLVGPVPAWEAGLALALLMGATWFVRRGAGRVFRVAMLMYGKEPSWSEIRRWLRTAE
jgi:ABC-2 type transport system permease protein